VGSLTPIGFLDRSPAFASQSHVQYITHSRSLGSGRSTHQRGDLKGILLDPWFVTGLVDAEGCFNIVVTPSTTNFCVVSLPDVADKIGWAVQIRFILELHLKDYNLLVL
jgi:hypothetical protein